MRRSLGCWALFLGLLCSSLAASAADTVSIPSALQPWKSWVLKGFEYRNCPFIATSRNDQRDNYLCAWPGRLQMAADQHGAMFAQHWQVDAPAWVPLPGTTKVWPLDVQINGRPAVVLEHAAAPSVWLEPGSYEIKGRLLWEHRPQRLTIPEVDGLIQLAVDGHAVPNPERDEGGLILGRSGVVSRESLDVRVYRKLVDGVPAVLDTHIEFDVNGQAREQVFGAILPKDFEPLDIRGDLVARLDAAGKLHVQLQPGSWSLDIRARGLQPLTAVTLQQIPAPWPTQEIWSYVAVPRLRVTSVHGVSPIDPAQADVPSGWQQFPAFVMTRGSTLSVTESSRGLASTDSNRLTLQREARLDFDGSGFYYTDRIRGMMKRGWRLDVPAPYVLENARQQQQPLLITQGRAKGETGIEVRNPGLDITAGLRLPHDSSKLPVAGWQQPFESVSTQLYLPYGYLLVGAPGADTAAGSWISLWTLLDIFVVAVIGVLSFRLLGKTGGALAIVYLILAYHEPGAPVWTLALIVVLELACKWLPEGRLARWAGWTSRVAVLLFALVALPFLANQIRCSIYPQLQSAYEWGLGSMQASRFMHPAPPMLMKTQVAVRDDFNAPESMPVVSAIAPQAMGKVEVTGSSISTSMLVQRYAPDTVIQAGESAPQWTLGSEYQLAWSGPVVAGQTTRLFIAPPWLTRLLRVLLIGLLAALIVMLLRRRFETVAKLRLSQLPRGSSLMLLVLMVAGTLLPRPGHADAFPPDKLLTDLRTRLTEAPVCLPQCARIPRADINAAGNTLTVHLTIAAAQPVAVPIPSAQKSLQLTGVTLDGVAQDAALQRDAALWINVPRGVHLVALRYSASADSKLSVSFGIRPDYVNFSGSGWQVDGISEHHMLTDALGLTRTQLANHPAAIAAAQQFAPFVDVTRTVTLDLDWRLNALVRRIAPAQGGFSVTLPLLPDEHVLSGQYTVHDGRITIPIQNASGESSWLSTLDRSASFTLSAPAMTDHAEIWKFIVSPTWHAEFSGLPAVEPARRNDDFWVYEFHPLPGEHLTVHVTRPAATAGSTLAIDDANLMSSLGAHGSENTLRLKLHGTRAGEHGIVLPGTAELLSVTKDHTALNLPLHDGKLVLPITAADQVFEIRWRQSGGAGFVNRTPAVDLDASAANISTRLQLPRDRWVLMAFGPRVGPAVLYWGELVTMILVAFALSKAVKTPLKFRHWLLLGLGFSTFSWLALLTVVVWILALQWRAGWQPAGSSFYRLNQILLIGLTVIALGSIVSSIPLGLLGVPDMHITGNGSSVSALNWFVDHGTGLLPHGTVISLPMWCYKLAMLAWALWLAFALVEWLRWGFTAWSAGGYWPSPVQTSTPAADKKRDE